MDGLGIIGPLAAIIGTIVLVVFFVRALLRVRGGIDLATDAHWYLRPFLTSRDALGQLLLAIAIALGTTGVMLVGRMLRLDLAGEWYLLVGSLVAFILAWALRAPLLGVAGVLGAYGWWLGVAEGPMGLFDRGQGAGAGIALLGVAAYGAGRLLEQHDRTRRLGFFVWATGLGGLVVALFSMSSSQVDYSASELGSALVTDLPILVAAYAVLATAAIALAWAFIRRAVQPGELGVLAAVVLAAFANAVVPASENVWLLVFNVLLLAVLLGLVLLGYLRREDWLVSTGAVLLFAFVIAKYFDWAATFLDRSIAFIGAGVLFLVVGWFMEQGRRLVIRSMGADDAHG